MKTVLIIDGNALAYRIYSSFAEGKAGLLTNSVGIPTTVIFGFLRALQTFTDRFTVDKTIICWDVGGGSKWRKSLFPYYKANRTYKDMSDYFEELDSARTYFEMFGMNQAICKGVEADDVVGWLAKKYSKENKVIIFSDDKDFYQCTGKNIKVYRPLMEEMIDYNEAKSRCKIFPEYMPKVDALTGQSKDNIPGGCDLDEDGIMQKYGFGPAKALKLLFNCDFSLKRVRKTLEGDLDGIVSVKFKQQLLKNWKQVMVSYKISTIRLKDKQYNSWELQLLQDAYDSSVKGKKVNSKNIMMLHTDLEFTTINTIAVLKKIGVNVKGSKKTLMKSLRVKT